MATLPSSRLKRAFITSLKIAAYLLVIGLVALARTAGGPRSSCVGLT
jgi:hypothetical protein